MLAAKKDPATGKAHRIVPYKRVPYRRVLSLAYPEVAGVFTSSSSRQIAATARAASSSTCCAILPSPVSSRIVTYAFRKKYAKHENPRLLSRPARPEHLSQYLKLFLVELRREVGNDMDIRFRLLRTRADYALRGRNGCRGAPDTIKRRNWYSGNAPVRPSTATVDAAGSVAMPWPSPIEATSDRKKAGAPYPALFSAERQHACPTYSAEGRTLSDYETTLFTWQPEMRQPFGLAGLDFLSQEKDDNPAAVGITMLPTHPSEWRPPYPGDFDESLPIPTTLG